MRATRIYHLDNNRIALIYHLVKTTTAGNPQRVTADPVHACDDFSESHGDLRSKAAHLESR